MALKHLNLLDSKFLEHHLNEAFRYMTTVTTERVTNYFLFRLSIKIILEKSLNYNTSRMRKNIFSLTIRVNG